MLERRMDSYTIETTHWGDDWVAKRTRRLRPVSRKVGTGKTSGGKKRWICYELFAMKYPTEFYEAVGPRFGFKSFEKHERAQGIPSAVNFVTTKELFLSMGHDLIDFCKDVTDDT
ncbi:unnamed protein product [Arabidopsis thaliana]|uniref:Uncharacterized protein n=1 Tax=Arabidopsis thaliana TaxID=3702 RepID=A0A654G5N6_ARATH|nr:unnamed protein product [Arabidopsis thaliana]